ncbi:MAG: NuoM family protein [Cytophagales bacterium]
MPILSIILFFPLLASLGVLFFDSKNAKAIRNYSIVAAVLELLLIAFLGFKYNYEGKNYQFTEKLDWITLDLGSLGRLSIDYALGIDGISFPLLLLTSVIFLTVILASYIITDKQKGYYSILLLLYSTINGCFLALDFFLFYLFFEFMLLPMYFLIGIWGGPRKEYAAIKFFLYTLLGSIFILIAMIALYMSVVDPVESILLTKHNQFVHTFRFEYLSNPKFYISNSILHPDAVGGLFGFTYRQLAFLLLFFGFAVKLPSVPFHTWLPDAHVEAPTPVSVVLASVLLKIGAYGLIRIAYPIFPSEAVYFSVIIGAFGVASILYAGYNALAQNDLKKMIAYSSVSHMGFVLVGLASVTVEGITGAVYQMVSHGFISASLFLIAGFIYEQSHDRTIQNYMGLANKLPNFTIVTVITFFASLGLPGLSGFVAEILVFLGAFKSELIPKWFAIAATFGLVLSAAYYLWTLQRMFFGKFWLKDSTLLLVDLRAGKLLVFIPLLIFIIALGVFPSLLTTILNPAVQELMLRFAD